MASNRVYIAGDSSGLGIVATNISGSDPLEFVSGSFRSTPEERRVASVFFNVAGSQFELRFEFTSKAFVEHTITGAPITIGEGTL